MVLVLPKWRRLVDGRCEIKYEFHNHLRLQFWTLVASCHWSRVYIFVVLLHAYPIPMCDAKCYWQTRKLLFGVIRRFAWWLWLRQKLTEKYPNEWALLTIFWQSSSNGALCLSLITITAAVVKRLNGCCFLTLTLIANTQHKQHFIIQSWTEKYRCFLVFSSIES